MMYGTRDNFEYFECGKCGCLQISSYPADIYSYYGPNYYSFKDSDGESIGVFLKNKILNARDKYEIIKNGLAGAILSFFSPNWNLRILSYYIRPCFSRKKTINILDVGCGSGHFLKFLSSLGFESLTGLDPFIQQDRIEEGNVKIYKKELEEVVGEYDLIFLNHSLEHMKDQYTSLSLIAKLLAEDGLLFISIPLTGSYAWNVYGVDWVQLDAPRHFYLHTIESMKNLCCKAGFNFFDVHYNSTAFQFWGSELYKNDISLIDYMSGKSRIKFSMLQLIKYKKMAHKLNINKKGDAAVFVLKKNNVVSP